MPVVVGTAPGEWPPAINHVSNGEPANETVLKRPSVDLENRTVALRMFTETEEAGRDVQIGPVNDSNPSSSVIGGLLGTFQQGHAHSGGDGSVKIDLQKMYTNTALTGPRDSVITLDTAGSFTVKANDTTELLKIDEATKLITSSVVGGVLDVNTLKFGTGAGEVNADTFPSGSTRSAVTLAQKNSYDAHLTLTSDNPHGHKYQGYPLKLSNVIVTGGAHDVTAELVSETPGGADGVEGVVTDPAHNMVIIKDTADDTIVFEGNAVYGRITESTGVWALTFYTNVSGVETAYTSFSSQEIQWWVQKIYAPQNRPIYSPSFGVKSDQTASVVNWGAVPDHMIPAGTQDLGTASKQWADTYLADDGRLYFGDHYIEKDVDFLRYKNPASSYFTYLTQGREDLVMVGSDPGYDFSDFFAAIQNAPSGSTVVVTESFTVPITSTLTLGATEIPNDIVIQFVPGVQMILTSANTLSRVLQLQKPRLHMINVTLVAQVQFTGYVVSFDGFGQRVENMHIVLDHPLTTGSPAENTLNNRGHYLEFSSTALQGSPQNTFNVSSPFGVRYISTGY